LVLVENARVFAGFDAKMLKNARYKNVDLRKIVEN